MRGLKEEVVKWCGERNHPVIQDIRKDLHLQKLIYYEDEGFRILMFLWSTCTFLMGLSGSSIDVTVLFL